MQPNTNVGAANLIPAAHVPQAVNAVAGSKNPAVLEQLKSMQLQLNALIGNAAQEQLPDVVLVNSSGRLVEVDGSTAVELLSKPGFRKATTDEETRYRKAIIRQTPQYLRRMEKKRLIEEQKMLDEIEAEDDSDTTSVEDLLHAPVTEAQSSGTPAPAAATPAPNNADKPTAPAANEDSAATPTAPETQTSANEESTPKPPSRRKKAASNKSNNNTTTS